MKYLVIFSCLLCISVSAIAQDDDYRQYLTEAEKYYKRSNYKLASNLYQEALFKKPADEFLINKVIECDQMLEALNGVAEDNFGEPTNIFLKYADINKDANFYLGFIYHRGLSNNGVSLKNAIKHYNDAFEMGHLNARDSLNMLVNENLARAISDYNKSDFKSSFTVFDLLQNNSAEAKHYLGLSFLNGHGVEKDEVKAFEILKEASVEGDALAKKEIASLEKKLRKSGDLNCYYIENYDLKGGKSALKYFFVPGLAQNDVRSNKGPYYLLSVGAYGSLATGIYLKVKSKNIYENDYLTEVNSETGRDLLDKANSFNHAGYILIGVGAGIWISDFIVALAKGRKNERIRDDCNKQKALQLAPLINNTEGSLNVGINIGF